jgi:hypothetical protein
MTYLSQRGSNKRFCGFLARLPRFLILILDDNAGFFFLSPLPFGTPLHHLKIIVDFEGLF